MCSVYNMMFIPPPQSDLLSQAACLVLTPKSSPPPPQFHSKGDQNMAFTLPDLYVTCQWCHALVLFSSGLCNGKDNCP